MHLRVTRRFRGGDGRERGASARAYRQLATSPGEHQGCCCGSQLFGWVVTGSSRGGSKVNVDTLREGGARNG